MECVPHLRQRDGQQRKVIALGEARDRQQPQQPHVLLLEHASPQPRSSQPAMSQWAIDAGGGNNGSPRRRSSRLNQRTSSSSSSPTRASPLTTRASKLSISEAGNGHGWLPR